MPRNGSGAYSRAVTPPVNGDVADADDFNDEMDDFATAITNSLAKNGETTPTANLPMGGFVHTGLGAGDANGESVRFEQLQDAVHVLCQGRLTLSTGVPVTTADVTAATTLYFTPYLGNRIALYDGSNYWVVRTFTELSITVPSTTSTMYDVFVYDNSGAPTLELTAWTNDTTRATALTTQNGVYVKNGATTRRYLGSFRTTGVSGQTEDSKAKRYVWNLHNRRPRLMQALETTDTWTYTTATIRQVRGSSANQLEYVCGLSEDSVSANAKGVASNTSSGVLLLTAIGLDSTTVASGLFGATTTPGANFNVEMSASYEGFPGIGRHVLSWLEYSAATGVTTWLGDGGGLLVQTGIKGRVMA